MRRLAAVSLVALVMSVRVPPFVAAQARPSSGVGTLRPLCKLGCGGGGGEDVLPPDVAAPSGGYNTPTPNLTVNWCDNVSLNSSTRYISINGVNVTASFDYVSQRSGCAAAATSSTGSVNLSPGNNTVYASICDLAGNCGSDTETLVYNNHPTPFVSLSPYNADVQSVRMCAVACFAATYAQSTVPYFTLDAPRNVTLMYHGDRVDPKPFIHANVQHSGVSVNLPVAFYLRLQRSNGAFVTFLNGETSLRFQPSLALGNWIRMGGQFDAATNGMASTGVYPVTVVVGADYGGAVSETSVGTRVIVVNQNGSPLARGWTVDGMQQAYPQNDGSVLIVEGDGTATYFQKSGSEWITPAGDFTTLTTTCNAGCGTYQRVYPDSTRVQFNLGNTLAYIRDRYGNETDFLQSGASQQPYLIQDPTNSQFNTRQITFGYDTNGVSSIADAFGRVTQVSVDNNRNLVSITDPDGVSTHFAYASGRLAAITDRRGATTTFAYHSQAGKLVADSAAAVAVYGEGSVRPTTLFTPWQVVSVPYGATSPTPFSPARADTVKASVIDPGGHLSQFTVNAFGEPLKTTGPLGDTVTVAYNGSGQPAQISDRLGVSTSYVYDASGFAVQTTRGGVVLNARNGGWNEADSTWGQGAATRSFLAAATGRVDSLRIGGQAGQQPSAQTMTRYTYDSRGRGLAARDNAAHLIEQRWYNGAEGNLGKDSTPSGSTMSYTYDTYGRLQSTTRAGQPSRTMSYDPANRLVTMHDGVNPNPTILAYDGLLDTSVTDPIGQTYRVSYNSLGWPTSHFDPTGASDTLQYDRDGLLRRVVNRRAQAILTTYDALHRRLLRSGPGVGDTMTYSGDGRVVTASNAIARIARYLNAQLQPDSIRTALIAPATSYVQNYRYSGEGWLQSTWTSGSYISWAHQNAWRTGVGTLDSLRRGTTWTRMSMSNDLLTMTLRFTADSLSRTFLEDHDVSSVTSTTFLEQYGYDLQGRNARSGAASASQWRNFAYDSLNRLARTTFNSSFSNCASSSQQGWNCTWGNSDSSHIFSYDPSGNRTDHFGEYGFGNRILSFDDCFYTTDPDGNVDSRICPGEHVSLSWSADGLLTGYTVGGTSIGLAYDPLGRLVRRDVGGTPQSYFLWDGSDLLAELASDGVTLKAEYSYFPGTPDALHSVLLNNASYVVVTDGLGSVRQLTDGSGSIKRTYRYGEWGQLVSGTDNLPFAGVDRVRWKGALWMGPELDLYYMRNRWYEPKSGRFLSEDPMGLAAGINQYAFGSADPVGLSDPFGLDPCAPNTEGHWDPPVTVDGGRYAGGGSEPAEWHDCHHTGGGPTGGTGGAGKSGGGWNTGATPGAGDNNHRRTPVLGPAIGRLALGLAHSTMDAALTLAFAPLAFFGSGPEGWRFTFDRGHALPHTLPEGMNRDHVELAIRNQILSEIDRSGGSIGYQFGRLDLGGHTIQYRAYPIGPSQIHVGTYFPVSPGTFGP